MLCTCLKKSHDSLTKTYLKVSVELESTRNRRAKGGEGVRFMGTKYCGNSQVEEGGQRRGENTISPTSLQKYLQRYLKGTAV